MPKTFTDDIAAPFPDLVTGPFRIVSATDPGSYISVDPANAAIHAFASARPTRSLAVAFLRTYLTTSAQFIGTAIPARSVAPSDAGGYYAFPFRIPEGMDLAAPSSVKILVAPASSATTNGQVVRYNLTVTRVTPAGVETTINVTYDWPVPDNWQATTPLVLTLDNGNGWTFDANAFTAGDSIGFRLARLGSDTQDTFDKNVKIGESIYFEYRVKAL